jgi:eukaryotic-like serine/threonine-protein kinase
MEQPLAPNTAIAHYRLLAPLGAGGMGEVYLAEDTKLGRKVALKLLPAEFTRDAGRLRRFEQEARAASALNHPNILTIFEIGETNGERYIATEFIDGQTLRERLNGDRLAAPAALDIAAQIAAALTAAHEAGIVHRDIKPENVMLRRDGIVKVLDFGLAKLIEHRPATVDSQAPTIAKAHTDPGAVLGTVGYMSPEQVRGQEADHRADIFSFGVILYEMLSGRRTFSGGSAVEVMNAILKEDQPELGETNAKISPALDKIVRRCLEKKPERRFQSASDLSFALEALSLPGSSWANRTEMSPAASAWSKSSGWRRRIWMIVAVVLAMALLAFGVAYFRRPAPEAEPMRLFVNSPEKATRFDLPAISPDGSTLAFIATVEGKTQLWVRSMNSATAKPVAEVGETGPPFWSPDSRFIGFFENSKLKKIALAGGAPETLCDTPGALGGGAWNREGIILFSGGNQGIRRVSANSGPATTVTAVANSRGEIGHFAPVFLPDGRNFIFFKATSDPSRRGAYLASLDVGEKNLLLQLDNPIVGVTANPSARDEGYLVFARQGALMAQSFDFSRKQLLGDPVRLTRQVEIFARAVGFANAVQASLSANGVLVLIEGNDNQQLAWFDRAGKKLRTVGTTGIYLAPRLSHDERYLAVGRSDLQSQTSDIYLFDLARGTERRFTFDPGVDEFPLWFPDGSRIVWTSYREGVGNLYQKAASGAGPDEALLRSDFRKRAIDWSADGRFILYQENNPQTSLDLWVLSLEGERSHWPWLKTPFIEPLGKFSPDGKWIAYQSNESGYMEIYLQAFTPGAPASGGRWQLSTNGGAIPQWRRDGRELYYISADNKLMAVEVTLGAEVKYGTPKELFALSDRRVETVLGGYARTRDGQQFLFATSAEETILTPLTVVLNWMAEVKK